MQTSLECNNKFRFERIFITKIDRQYKDYQKNQMFEIFRKVTSPEEKERKKFFYNYYNLNGKEILKDPKKRLVLLFITW